MYKVLFGKYDTNAYAPLIVCPYHAAVYLRNAPYTGHSVVKHEGGGDCRCCNVDPEQKQKALSTPEDVYSELLRSIT